MHIWVYKFKYVFFYFIVLFDYAYIFNFYEIYKLFFNVEFLLQNFIYTYIFIHVLITHFESGKKNHYLIIAIICKSCNP